MKSIYLCLSVFFVIINHIPLQSEDYIDSSQYEVPRILNSYKMYQNKYETKAWNLLISFINDDEILKQNFLNGDSAELKN